MKLGRSVVVIMPKSHPAQQLRLVTQPPIFHQKQTVPHLLVVDRLPRDNNLPLLPFLDAEEFSPSRKGHVTNVRRFSLSLSLFLQTFYRPLESHAPEPLKQQTETD